MKRFQLKDDDDAKYYLLGVVSYGPKNCGSGPGVYAKVAYFLDWILENIAKNV